ncbi:hypothetical protein C0993_005394 [Termitomyces sp. T159_Od127]|nr:hypothetical protein C0993_005394 [Termitomyces sp. T159_Od127]
MSSWFQRLQPDNQAQRAREQALDYIDKFPPIIINGQDITCDAREAVRMQIDMKHMTTLEQLQPRRGQFLGGLFAFFLEIRQAKEEYKAKIIEFESETEKVRYEALEAIEREVAKRISQEDTAKLLNLQSGRLSNDTKRVANQIYKRSIEFTGESDYALSLNRRIWEKNDIEEFEKNQEQEARSLSIDTPAQQAARVTSFQGLPPPPRVALKSEQVEVQESIEVATPYGGKHRRQETFVTFGSVSSGGSSGYEASSSGGSKDSCQAASSLDEDSLENIDVEAMYNNVAEVLDLYHESLDRIFLDSENS